MTSKRLATFWVSATIIISIFAQMWGTSVASFSRQLLYPMWMASIPMLILVSKLKVIRLTGQIKSLVSCGILFILYCLLIHGGVGGFMKFAGTVILCYVTGYILAHINVNNKGIAIICTVYVVSTVLLAYFIQNEHIGSMSDWIGRTTYSYGSKNSAGQIMAAGCIICLFYLSEVLSRNDHRVSAFIFKIIFLFLLVMIVLVECRAALIGLTIVFLIAFYRRFKNERNKLGFVVLAAVLIIVFISNDYAWNIVMKSLQINKYENTSLNEFSSGRIGLWFEALQTFSLQPFLGQGAYYVDNMYICLLTENGIVGFVILMCVHIPRMTINLGRRIDHYTSDRQSLLFTVKCLTVFFFVESFFEGYPPFGPGICSCMYWLLSGFCDYSYSEYEVPILKGEGINI